VTRLVLALLMQGLAYTFPGRAPSWTSRVGTTLEIVHPNGGSPGD
jgi:hypothetical protein